MGSFFSPQQSTSTTKTVSNPWEPQQPYLKNTLARAEELYQAPGPQYYPGSTVAPFSAEQQQAQSMAAARAGAGNPLNAQAQQHVGNVLGGQYLNDPYQDQVFENIRSHVMPSVNSQFSAAGRYGSNAHADAAARGLTDSYAPYASNNWQNALGMMNQAARDAPGLAQTDYFDIGQLAKVGAEKQGLAQQEIGDAIARWQYAQDLPYLKLNEYAKLTGGSFGGTQTSSTPYYQPSPFSQILGAGLGLAGTIGPFL